ncbi:MAG: polysaccharide deacetylase family protein [Gemmatimonadota bacterium]|nr:polysaccharide deacetylase family protein [Gemmatimonadota bacterium]
MTLRGVLKSTIEHGALWSGLPRAMRERHGGEVLVLAYHNIVPTGEHAAGDLSLHLPQARFAAQLDALARTHDIIPLARAIAGYDGRRPAAVITFDDAYQGAVTAGIAELAQRGLPATIFVATAFLNGGDFWWDALTAPGAGGPAPELRARALAELAGADVPIRAMAARENLAVATTPPAHARGALEHDLSASAAVRGITLALHTHTHPNLARLANDALQAELDRPLAWLRERFENVLPILSYPYGLSSPAVEIAAQHARYTAAFRIEGGWLPRTVTNAFALPRLDVSSGLSDSGFALRCSGVHFR